MKSKFKTLQVAGDSKYGGGTYLILKWCSYLLEHGFDVDVISTDSVTINELQKIPGVNIFQNIYIPREIHIINDLVGFLKLFKLLVYRHYDVVHTYSATPGLIGRISARLAGVPVILHHQAGWAVNEFSSKIQKIIFSPLEYLAVQSSTKSICVSYAVAEYSKQLRIIPSNKLVVIPNGIDPDPFLSILPSSSRLGLKPRLNLPDDSILIGSTSRLADQKDIPTLIDAIGLLNSSGSSKKIYAILAGDGPQRINLENYSKNKKLEKYVCYLGFQRDIPNILDKLDIFVLTSLWEGLSISLLEAMAAARPVIATSIPSNAELIEHEVTGLLVPPRDPKALAAAILRFISEPTLAQHCAENARQRVLEKYTLSRMFEETWKLYNQLLAKE